MAVLASCIGLVGKKVGNLGDQAGAEESFFDVIALQIDVGIDFVSEAVVALVAFEADIVSSRADPKRFSIHSERRFPYAQMIAGLDDA